MRNIGDLAFDYFPYALFGFVALFLGFAALVGVVAYRAEPAEIACRSQGMDHARRSFSARVTCVPRAGHSVDTLIIRSPN
jgi:hypothetical protein